MSHATRALALASQFPSQFTIQYPPSRRFFKSLFLHSSQTDTLTSFPFYKNNLSTPLLLYIHVPFCEHKCTYCNFSVDVRNAQQRSKVSKLYVQLLSQYIQRVDSVLGPGVYIPGIDIGGGTPTLLDESELSHLMQHVHSIRNTRYRPIQEGMDGWDMSIESTPFIASNFPDKLKILKHNGVGRVSIGLQSSSQELLDVRLSSPFPTNSYLFETKDVNRHKETLKTHYKAIRNLRDTKFDRVHIDLMFGLRNQTMDQWEMDVQHAIALDPDSITTYDCLYRGAGRAFMFGESKINIPSPKLYGQFYDRAYSILSKAKYYAPYGSVNFSKRLEETGTSRYFQGRLLEGLPYLGLGNYASSLFDNTWLFAPYTVDEWLIRSDKILHSDVNSGICHPVGDLYRLPLEELAAKYLLLSLSFGVIDLQRFERIFGTSVYQLEFVQQGLETVLEKSWMRQEGSTFVFEDKEAVFEILPQVRSLFYSPNAIKWVEDSKKNIGSMI